MNVMSDLSRGNLSGEEKCFPKNRVKREKSQAEVLARSRAKWKKSTLEALTPYL
jgi:asparagine synthetase A